MKQTFRIAPLTGDDDELMRGNSSRGFRIEVYLDVASGNSIYEYAETDAIVALKKEFSYYAQKERPTVAQVYFYLTGYRNRALDQTAFKHMAEYFAALKKLKMKALLRFAYVFDDGNPMRQAASTEQIIQHLGQLAPFIKEQRNSILALQAGLVGPWGEWSARARDKVDEYKIIQALISETPSDLPIQVRYINIRNRNIDVADHATLARIGYHDDFLIGQPHIWNTAGAVANSFEYQQMLKTAPNVLVDGEMIWWFANSLYIGRPVIDAQKMVKRLVETHFTTLSLAHNYNEFEHGSYYQPTWQNEIDRQARLGHQADIQDNQGSLEAWKKVFITPEILHSNHFPFQPSWFTSASGAPIKRSYFEYLQDYLGYRLAVEKLTVNEADSVVEIGITIKNYGFAAPLGLNQIIIVQADHRRQILDQKSFRDLSIFQTGTTQQIQARFKSVGDNMRIGLILQDLDGTRNRLANKIEYSDGINWLQ